MYLLFLSAPRLFHDLTRSREPDCEDDETQAETRKIRSLSVAVGFDGLVEAAVWKRQVDPKVVLIGIKFVSGPTTEPSCFAARHRWRQGTTHHHAPCSTSTSLASD